MTTSQHGKKSMNSVRIFCGSAVGAERVFIQAAQATGQLSAQQGRVLNDVRGRYYEVLGAQQAMTAALGAA